MIFCSTRILMSIKKGNLPPTSPEYICEIHVTKEEHYLIMKLRNHGIKLAEQEFEIIKKDNTTRYKSETARKSVKRKIQESNATKVAFDPKLHDIEPTFDSDANMFENEDSDMVHNDSIVKIPDNRAGEDLTKKFTVYVKFGKKKNNKVVTIELSRFSGGFVAVNT